MELVRIQILHSSQMEIKFVAVAPASKSYIETTFQREVNHELEILQKKKSEE